MKRKKRRVVLAALLALLLFAGGGVLGYFTCLYSFNENELALLQAYQAIETCFVGEYDETETLQTTLEAMVDSLGDRWSYYLTPEQAERIKQTRANSYVGIGVTIDYEVEDGLRIVSVTAGGPAEEAGLVSGEIIRAVDGTSITADNQSEIISAISGEEGTVVALEIEGSDGAYRTVEIERKTVRGITVTWTMLENNVGYLYISAFYDGTADLFEQGIEALLAQGAQALVIDVRNNPGGYVSEVTDVLDLLLPEGDIFISESYNGNQKVYTSDADCVDLPMAVLLNADSYSAAEFLGAQLRESIGAILVGEQTSGKGYAQVLIDLADGSSIGLSTSRYYTGGGVSLIGTGLTPDVELSLSEEKQEQLLLGTLSYEEDDQLQAAILALGLAG